MCDDARTDADAVDQPERSSAFGCHHQAVSCDRAGAASIPSGADAVGRSLGRHVLPFTSGHTFF
jgi:hypothetical protein